MLLWAVIVVRVGLHRLVHVIPAIAPDQALVPVRGVVAAADDDPAHAFFASTGFSIFGQRDGNGALQAELAPAPKARGESRAGRAKQLRAAITRCNPPSGALRFLLVAQAVVLGGAGGLMFVSSAALAPFWPRELAPVTARVAAGFLSDGVVLRCETRLRRLH